MAGLSASTLKKLSLLLSLYIAQGLPFGFFSQSLPALLREQGISLEMIGLMNLLALPWAAKWLFAPFVDKSRQYRFWVLAANLCSILICLLLSCFTLKQLVQQQLWLLYAGILSLNLAAASQDIATDAIAVIRLTKAERGIGNGIQIAGFRIGMILSGGLLLAWFSKLGWNSSLLILATLLGLTSLPVLFVRQEKTAPSPQDTFDRKSAFWLILHPANRIWVVTLCLYKLGESTAIPMLRPLLVDQGQPLTLLAKLSTIGFAASLIGSITGGLAINWLGHRLALRFFLVLTGISLFSYAWIALARPPLAMLQLAWGLEHLASGMATAALFTEMMYHCRPRHEATDYTLQSCLVVLITLAGASASGFLAQKLGYPAMFLLCAVLTLAVLPFLLRYQAKRHLLGQAPTPAN